MNTPILNFILPSSLIKNDLDTPLYLQDLVSKVKLKMLESEFRNLFDLCPEALEVNYKLFKDKILNPEIFRFQKIQQIINKWSEQSNEKINLHLCYNLIFYYKFILDLFSYSQIKFDEGFIQELDHLTTKFKTAFKESIDKECKTEIDDQIILSLSILKIDLITICIVLFFNDGINCNKLLLENLNNTLVQETHKIIKLFSKFDLPVIANHNLDTAMESIFKYENISNSGQDDEFAEPDLTEWHKSLD